MKILADRFNTILFKRKSKKQRKKKAVASPILPTECMQRIFHYIQQDDAKLYPSLLVNRYWCKNVVNLLWDRPFRLCSKRNRYKLISTLLMFFSLEETSMINAKLSGYNLAIPAQQQSPLFNYSAMIHEIHYMKLEEFVVSFSKKFKFGYGSEDIYRKVQILFITGSLFQMFLRQSTNLKTLVIDKEICIMDLPDVSIFPKSKSNSTKITQLKIDYDGLKIRNISDFLKHISETCNDIQILEFKFNTNAYNTYLLDSISKITRAQIGLKEFSLSNVQRFGIQSIMTSLLAHVNTLTSISLAFLELDRTTMDILLNLNQLKEFKLWFCEGLNHYTFIHTFKLYDLHLVELSTRVDQILRSILQSTGISIKRLGFNIQNIENLDVALDYCPNLENITLFYLSNKNQTNKTVNNIVNRLEKSWKEKLTLHKEIDVFTKTLIYHQ